MASASQESRILLVLQAIKLPRALSLYRAAKVYNVPYNTLRDQSHGKPARRDTLVNSRKLTDSKELVIIQYTLELYSKRFPPRLSGVEDMANHLLASEMQDASESTGLQTL
jgi:hypothetical protein